jgi:hypothetical protein
MAWRRRMAQLLQFMSKWRQPFPVKMILGMK